MACLIRTSAISTTAWGGWLLWVPFRCLCWVSWAKTTFVKPCATYGSPQRFFILAERIGSKKRGYDDLTMRDAIVMGLAQCLALIPGVSRSGGTISAGLFVGLNREVAARFSFLLAIPAVFASGIFSLPDAFAPQAGQAASGAQLLIGSVIAFAVGYASIAWFLKFVSSWFAVYRIPAGLVVMALLAAGILAP